MSELLRVRAVVCLVFLVLLPPASTILLPGLAGFSIRDGFLSALSIVVVKAGLVPLGFAIGALWPRPGQRCLALLPLGAWWLGISAWAWLSRESKIDYHDRSLTFAVVWVLVLLALPWIIRARRSLWSQVMVAACALAMPWLTHPIMRWLEAVPQKTAEAAGLTQARLSATPHNFQLTQTKDTSVEFDLHMTGLPPGTAAEIRSAILEIEWPNGKHTRADWRDNAFLMSTWYDAIAQVMGTSPENFPEKWRHEDDYPAIILERADFNSLSDTQAVKITGRVRVRLHHLQSRMQGVYREKWQLPSGGLRFNGALGEMTLDGGSVLWLRPWLAEAVAKGDTSERGILFNITRTRWCTVLQPPVQTGPGKFSRDARRDPPLWADTGTGAPNFNNFFGWTASLQSSNSHNERIPELNELLHAKRGGVKGLPLVVLSCTSTAEIELPLEPLTVTRQQILDTRKITPTKP